MGFETSGAYESTGESIHNAEHDVAFRERFGGPLESNHFLTTKLGLDEAKPILERLKIPYRTSLYAPEMPIGEEAVAPAEYRIEVMDGHAPNQAASEDNIQVVFNALKQGGVPVQRSASHRSETN